MPDRILDTYNRWKASGADKDKAELLKELEPTVQSALSSYGSGDKSLLTRARIMAADALNTYDPSRKAHLKTHVHNRLKSLYRIKGDRQNVIYVPENTRLDRTHVHAFMTEWRDQHGFDPDILTIAQGMNISQRRAKNALGYSTMPTSMATSDKGDVAGVRERDPKDVLMDYIYHDADPAGRRIIEGSWGYNGARSKSVNELAATLKMTPSAVSQRKGKILKQLSELESETG